MKNLLTTREKVMQALFGNSFKKGSEFTPQYFIVIDSRSGKPQFFSKTTDETSYDEFGFGAFMDADLDAYEEAPVEIYDRKTALFLIGQDAVYRSLCPDRLRDDVHDGPILRIMPVFGAMIPNCLPKNNVK